MQDDSITPDQQDNNNGDNGAKVYANASTLEVQGERPAVGDEVELTIKGTVDSVDGDVVCVSPTEVNGEPAPEAPGDNSNEPDADDNAAEHDRLMQKAMQADNGY